MITGIILAGGLNRRMGGRPKALLPWQGQPLIQKQLKEMARICKQIIIVTNEPEALQPFLAKIPVLDVQIVRDEYVQKGPLSGIHAASIAATADLLWIVGCDMPFISADAAAAMSKLCQEANLDAVIPVLDERIHPLHGIYSHFVGSKAEVLLKQEKYRLMGLLDYIDWQPADNRFFEDRQLTTDFATNVNTPEEYELMLGNLPY